MKTIGIYHLIDREILDLVAELHSQGVSRDQIRDEAMQLHARMGIGPKTSVKRSRPVFKAWLSNPTKGSEDATELYSSCNREEQLALHIAMLYRAYPFFIDVMGFIGAQIGLGSQVNQATIRNRTQRHYGQGENVRQAVRKVLQSLISWGLIHKTGTSGLYAPSSQFSLSFELTEVMLSGYIEGSKVAAISLSEIYKIPALFPWNVIDIRYSKPKLLNIFIEGIGEEFVSINYI
jgi:hypothetical protein